MTKNHASIASTFQITLYVDFNNLLRKMIILHIHPGFNVFDLKFMFFEHLVPKSFKQFLFVIFIHVIAIFIYTYVLLLIWNENNVKWNHELHQIFLYNTRRTIQFWFDL